MRLFSILLVLLVAVPAAAQEREIRSANLPPDVERSLLRMYEGGAERRDGESRVLATETVRGDLAAMGGPLRVAGRVTGDVAMVGGDVIVEPGGTIDGNVTVVGGEVVLEDAAGVSGTITTYGTSDRPARIRERDDDEEGDWEWEDEDRDDWWWERRRRDRRGDGYSRLTLRTGTSYNRVEGLPLMFGPVIRTAGPNPLRLEALAIWRSESGTLDTDRMGYRVRAEQFLANRRVSLGGSVFSVVDPLDPWQLSDLEASLAAAVFHDDYRDHFGRTGWSAFAAVRPTRAVEARLEYRQEEHDALPAGDPWSLFHGGDVWRYQPLVAEGDIRTLGGSVELDLRDHRKDPRTGWYGRVALERPVGGTLLRPTLDGVFPAATDVSTDFTTFDVDVRRYHRVGHGSQLSARLMAGGSLDGSSLPPQYQHVLGGPGSLPGFATFHADCGARAFVGERDGDRFFPAYGCDRFALAQVEYRGDLSLGWGFRDRDWDDDHWWGEFDVDFSPTWVVFMDAGRGWAYDDGALGADRSTGTLVDVGLGFLVENVGLYAALPLNGGVDQEPRFFLRLGRRF